MSADKTETTRLCWWHDHRHAEGACALPRPDFDTTAYARATIGPLTTPPAGGES